MQGKTSKRGEHESEWGPWPRSLRSLGHPTETVREWVRQDQVESGTRLRVTREASAFFAAELDRPRG